MSIPGRGAGQRGSITEYKKALESRKGKKANLKPLAKAAKGVAAAAVVAVGPGKIVKAVKAAKAAKDVAPRYSQRDMATIIAYRRAAAVPTAERTEAQKLAITKVYKGTKRTEVIPPAKLRVKTSAKTKKFAEPKSNVKILEGKSNKQRQKIMNAQRTAATRDAKSGTTAYRYAEEIKYQNQKARNSAVSRIKTIKIRGKK